MLTRSFKRPKSCDQEETNDYRTPNLSRITVIPIRYSISSASIAYLRNVDRVEIISKGGPDVYIVGVFYQRFDGRIPTRQKCSQNITTPDYQIERAFEDFEQLRSETWFYSFLFTRCPCEFCKRFAHFIAFNIHQPRFVVKYGTPRRIQLSVLQRFINTFIEMARNRQREKPLRCDGFEEIPALVEKILRK